MLIAAVIYLPMSLGDLSEISKVALGALVWMEEGGWR